MSQLMDMKMSPPSPLLDILLHYPPVSHYSPPSPPFNAIPMSETGDHYMYPGHNVNSQLSDQANFCPTCYNSWFNAWRIHTMKINWNILWQWYYLKKNCPNSVVL